EASTCSMTPGGTGTPILAPVTDAAPEHSCVYVPPSPKGSVYFSEFEVEASVSPGRGPTGPLGGLPQLVSTMADKSCRHSSPSSVRSRERAARRLPLILDEARRPSNRLVSNRPNIIPPLSMPDQVVVLLRGAVTVLPAPSFTPHGGQLCDHERF